MKTFRLHNLLKEIVNLGEVFADAAVPSLSREFTVGAGS